MRRWPGLLVLLGLTWLAQGCSLTMLVNKGAGTRTRAADDKDPGLKAMRRALDLHIEGDWQGSNREMAKAEAFFSGKPSIALGREVAALSWGNERSGAYRGAGFERFFLHTIGMLNFAFLGDLDAALVEARQVDALQQGARAKAAAFPEDPFARYLSAKLYEATGHSDDAYIDLVKAREGFAAASEMSAVAAPGFLAGDLLRLAKSTGRNDDLARWQKIYPGVEPAPLPDAGHGEVWVLVWHGWLPERWASGSWGKVVEGKTRPSPTWRGGNASAGGVKAKLEALENTEELLRWYTQERQKDAGARTMGRVITRVGMTGALLMAVVGPLGLLMASDPRMWEGVMAGVGQGDSRAWGNLPASVWAVRLRLPAKRQELVLTIETDQGPRVQRQVIQPKAGRIALIRFVSGRDPVEPKLSPSLRP